MSENNAQNEALKTSLEVNRILIDLQKERGKTQRLPWIICAVVVALVCATFLTVHFKTLNFFSQYEFYYEEIIQESNDGGGNNVYFPGENAQYNEAPKEE